jgi:hypothetical protein
MRKEYKKDLGVKELCGGEKAIQRMKGLVSVLPLKLMEYGEATREKALKTVLPSKALLKYLPGLCPTNLQQKITAILLDYFKKKLHHLP